MSYQSIDGLMLPIRQDDVCGVAPQMIHRVQMRASLGQPFELDAVSLGQGLADLGGVAGVLIQQQDHMPCAIMRVNQFQKGTEVHRPLTLTGKQQPTSRADVDRSEQHTLGILAAEDHSMRLSSWTPTGLQGREQQQVDLILNQNDATRRQMGQSTQNSPFFSLAAGPAPKHSGSVSRYSPAHAIAAEACERTAPVPTYAADVLPAGERSSLLRNSHAPAAIDAAIPPVGHRDVVPTATAVPGGADLSARPIGRFPDRHAASCKHSAGILPKPLRRTRWNSLHQSVAGPIDERKAVCRDNASRSVEARDVVCVSTGTDPWSTPFLRRLPEVAPLSNYLWLPT